MEDTLKQKTIRLVEESGLPYLQICRETGLKPRWLSYLMAGKYDDPGVNKIERLHAYLLRKQQERDAA